MSLAKRVQNSWKVLLILAFVGLVGAGVGAGLLISNALLRPFRPPPQPADLGVDKTVLAHTGPASSLAYSPDGKFLVTGSRGDSHSPERRWEGSFSLWDVAAKQQTRTIRTDQWVRDFAFSPDGKTLAVSVSCVDWERPRIEFVLWPGEVIFYDFPALKEQRRLALDVPIGRIVWSRKGKWFSVALLAFDRQHNECGVAVFETDKWQEVFRHKTAGLRTTQMITPDEKMLLVHDYITQGVASTSVLRKIDTRDWSYQGTIPAGSVERLELTPDDRWILLLDDGGSSAIDLANERPAALPMTGIPIEHAVNFRVSFSPDSKHVLFTTRRGGGPRTTSRAYVGGVAGSLRQLLEANQFVFDSHAWAPDGKSFAVTVNGPRGETWLFDISKMRQ